MLTQNFQNLIQLVTGRDFIIDTTDNEIFFEKQYEIIRVLPASKRAVGFSWKTPKSDEKMLRSFITAFTSKYREPNPANYKTCAPYFSPSWDQMTIEKQEFAYYHHSSNMYSKDQLMKQVEANFSNSNISSGLIKYGFYNTNYGIGIFCFWMTEGVQKAIQIMKNHLTGLSIPYDNELSEAGWVLRFKIGLSKETHLNIINQLTTSK